MTCRLLSHLLCSLVVNISNNMNLDQTAPLGAVLLGFIMFASMIKVAFSAFE